MYISWAALAGEDLDAEGYNLYMSEEGSEQGFKVVYDGTFNPNTLSSNITNLKPGNRYTFYVVANNFNGVGQISDELNTLVCLPP